VDAPRKKKTVVSNYISIPIQVVIILIFIKK